MLESLVENRLSVDRIDALSDAINANAEGYDPWGVHLGTLERAVVVARWMYENYFRVRTFGLDQIPEGSAMIVPNHSGQLPLDGMFIAVAMLYEAEQPRLLRSMIEKWFPRVPFLGSFMQRCGQVVGDPQNCLRLLEDGQSIMVFPEGVRGSGKTYWKRYQLQRFGTGFMRLALETATPIVPTAVIGCEEIYPSLYDAQSLARLLRIPYFPIWPQVVLGPLAAMPLPVQVDLHFGDPVTFDTGADATDEEVLANVEHVKGEIAGLIHRGRMRRAEESSGPLDRLIGYDTS